MEELHNHFVGLRDLFVELIEAIAYPCEICSRDDLILLLRDHLLSILTVLLRLLRPAWLDRLMLHRPLAQSRGVGATRKRWRRLGALAQWESDGAGQGRRRMPNLLRVDP